MVMKRNAMRKNLFQSIWKSFGRYVAIAAIIGLGTALFLGLLMTKSDMVATGQVFMDQQNMFDIRLIGTYGWASEQVEKAAELEGIADAEGVYYTDLIVNFGEDNDVVYRFYSMPENMNQISLRGGRMPENRRECLVDGFHIDDSILGTKVTVSETNDEDALESLLERELTVVGYVASPLYMDMNRGNTSVGSGTLTNYMYLPKDSFDVDYFTEIHLTLPGEYAVYSDHYNDTLESVADAIEADAEALAWDRFHAIKAEAEEEYQDGYQEYLDGIKEYEDGKAEGEQELEDALKELNDGEKEIKDNRKKLQNAERTLYDAKVGLFYKQAELNNAKQLLAENKAQVMPELDARETELKAAEQQLVAAFGAPLADLCAKANAAQAYIDTLKAQRDSYDQDNEQDKIAEIQAVITAYEIQNAPYLQNNYHFNQVYSGLAAVQAAKNEFAVKEKEIAAGEQQIAEGLAEIQKNITKVYDGYEELKEAEQEIADGWEDYYEGKAEFEQEIKDAEAELADAKEELAEAREDIDSMDDPELIILDRNSNVGYNNLNSSSDIVQGVSRVLPAFFLLIASLVCITTMTRMIEEERTQIGTLKALGYSNFAIISKYLVYAGSGAVLGCSAGVAVGTIFFPQILWQAYSIMLYITPDIVLRFNPVLAAIVIGVYTAVILSVTWYCCHRTLQEVPAELIRPKAPDAGKALLVERLPFWNKISFLNKVTIRNIFRYKQRLAMMLVGIGGCTALLVTGFGLQDSIVNVVDYQFEEVTVYDLEVYFREDQPLHSQKTFCQELGEQAADVLHYHQSSVDMDFDNRTKEIYMISADDRLQNFINFHSGENQVPLPGIDEIVLSVGVTDMLGIHIGDTVTIRNPDLQVMELTVSGIYDNHINNYSIVSPETIEKNWGKAPEQQMAFVKIATGYDAHEVSATISDMDNVMNVSVAEDMADMVGNMMTALDLVIWVIVLAAGLLAVIVLYNLTNININERIREIATIKVLGFNASETAAYVFKENMALTVVGSAFGLLLGKVFLIFVMSQIKIDMVWFKALVMPKSYVLSFVLTIVSAIIVDFVFYFKLQSINMAEALKSVE